jgi:hypothetical protein
MGIMCQVSFYPLNRFISNNIKLFKRFAQNAEKVVIVIMSDMAYNAKSWP